jgi:hypothetical protein
MNDQIFPSSSQSISKVEYIELKDFLKTIELDDFYGLLVDRLQVRSISHLNYVKDKDLQRIGMSKPAIRRLIDSFNKYKKQKTRESSKFYSTLLQTPPITNENNNKKEISIPNLSFLININDIDISNEILGSGNFGIVYKATWKQNNKQVAVKQLHNDSNNQHHLAELINEISCMYDLRHPNLIRLYGLVLDNNNSKGHLMMVTELAPFGSLLKYLRIKKEKNEFLQVYKLLSFCHQIASGMEYLELKKLIHMDLAARNILLFTEEQVKIGDFGMSRSVKNDDEGLYMMADHSKKIPCAWYPPESIENKIFSIKSDCWSFGITVWEIFTFGNIPWNKMNSSQVNKTIKC